MNKVEIYTGNLCGFCTAAKRLLDKKGANFSEININCGCPSNKVVNGNFGASMMKNPELVGNIIYSLKNLTENSWYSWYYIENHYI